MRSFKRLVVSTDFPRAMFSSCIRHVPSTLPLQSVRGRCSDQSRTLLQVCADRHFISAARADAEWLLRGSSCSYGPLGTELRRNLLEQWWSSVSRRSRAQVFGINSTSSSGGDGGGGGGGGGGGDHLRMVSAQRLEQILVQEELSKEQMIQELQALIQRTPRARTNLLQGALEQFVPMLELLNRKLPFGLAETGLCFQASDASGCPAEVTQASLVWFCSPRTSSQWLDHWTRQRLKWWRKFSLSPTDFSSSDVPAEQLVASASRGVNINYDFPWGREPVEALWSRGDAELLQTHGGDHSQLQCQKSVPHVVSMVSNVDQGLKAFLSNSLQLSERKDSKQRLHHRKVLKLHPVLAPIKVALDIGRGATAELRQVCEGLQQELMETNITVWPGYLETTATSMEQLQTKYDEMGVLFSVVISENTLESGLLQIRSRDTTIKETMHISEINNFLRRYISAADRI